MGTRLRRLKQLSWRERLLLVEAAIMLLLIRIALRFFRFGTVRSWVNHPVDADTGRDEAHTRYARQVLWAVKVAARRVLGEKPCLPQALAVRYLLRRSGIPAHMKIGVVRAETNDLKAHAWVECDGRVLIGGAVAPDLYVPLEAIESLTESPPDIG